jgi:hypothetical protein
LIILKAEKCHAHFTAAYWDKSLSTARKPDAPMFATRGALWIGELCALKGVSRRQLGELIGL